MSAQEVLEPKSQPALTDKITDLFRRLPERLQRFGQLGFQRLQTGIGLIAKAIFDEVPKLFDLDSVPVCKTGRSVVAGWPVGPGFDLWGESQPRPKAPHGSRPGHWRQSGAGSAGCSAGSPSGSRGTGRRFGPPLP